MTRPLPSSRRLMLAYAGGLAPVVVVWLVLAGWLAWLLYSRAGWSDRADEATVREWVDETRTFRKTLPELVREYVRMREDPATAGDAEALRAKRGEVREQMRSLAEPTRAYLNQLPGFPVVYRIEVVLAPAPGGPTEPEAVAWDSPLPRPRRQDQTRVRELAYRPLGDGDPRAVIRVEYQLHAFNRLSQQEQQRRQESLVAAALLVAATLLAAIFVYSFLSRERKKELQRLTAQADAEHRERELLEVRLRQQEAERAREELDRKLLQQQLDAATLEKRADQAEKSTLEMKSQLYASIGIMAGSYAHNIKNLLVRPNDLLARCMEGADMTREHHGMLTEVKSTLGTVTERLQQILRTVRRDPSKADMTRVDLAHLVRDAAATWGEMGRDKWKLRVTAAASDGPLLLRGDLSHLQQAVENLLFNARDATFEMRNHLRDEAKRQPDPAGRRQKLLDAAGWSGEVAVAARRDGDYAVLEVRDNGIGMTEEVRANCMRTHFTTKRDNALFAGYSAGMGLGLSFVAVVLEHHGAELTIQSQPLKGATFLVRFPLAEGPETEAS